jgi:hypothetical protein
VSRRLVRPNGGTEKLLPYLKAQFNALRQDTEAGLDVIVRWAEAGWWTWEKVSQLAFGIWPDDFM